HEVIAFDEKGGYFATSYLASKVTTQPPELKSGNGGQQFYDTAAGAIRDFTPITDGEVSIYYRGATVQGRPHVRHIRSAVVFDVLVRSPAYAGHKVAVARGVADVDDKAPSRSADSFAPGVGAAEGYPAGEHWWALAYPFENAFAQASAALGVRRPAY